MRAKITVILLFVSIASLQAQQQMFVEALENFITSRFWQYEEIPVTWKMKGTLQADINEGINNLIEDKPDLADYNLSRVLKEDSSLWQVYYYRAASRKQLRKFADAVKDLKSAIRLRPEFYEGYVELGKLYHLLGDSKESERSLRKAIQIDKLKPIAYYLKGDIELAQRQLRNATQNYEECLAMDSMFHDARIKLALLDLGNKKNQDIALQRLDRVLYYDSLQKNALLFRAILTMGENKKQSVKDLSKLIKVSPNNLMAYLFRGLLSTDLGEYERAFSDFRKVINAISDNGDRYAGQRTWLDKRADLQNVGHYTISRIYGLPENDAAKIRQAYCYMMIGAYNLSIEILNTTSESNVEPSCIYLKAVSYEHKGEHERAYEHYDRLLQFDKTIADAYKKRGIYRQKKRQFEKSVSDLNEALRLTPDAFVIYRIRGLSNSYLKRFNDAVSDYSSYLAHDSTNKEVLGYRGMAYMQNKERLKAYVDFARSDNAHMLNFKDMSRLIDSVLVKGDTAQALKALAPITEKYTTFTEGFAMKFKVHLKRGEWALVEPDVSIAVVKKRMDAPKSDQAYLLTVQAMNFTRHNRDEDALKALSEAIQIDKQNDLAYIERAKVWILMGKPSKAEKDLEQALLLGNKQAEQLLATVKK